MNGQDEEVNLLYFQPEPLLSHAFGMHKQDQEGFPQ